LLEIKKEGIKRKLVGIEIDGEPMSGPNTTFWKIENNNIAVGKVTSAVYSPRLEKNIALAMIEKKHTVIGTELKIMSENNILNARVVEKPFFDPGKAVAKS